MLREDKFIYLHLFFFLIVASEFYFQLSIWFFWKHFSSIIPAEPQIPSSVLFADKSLALKQSRFSRSFTPLNSTEILKEGDVVGVDAEFVTLNQVNKKKKNHFDITLCLLIRDRVVKGVKLMINRYRVRSPVRPSVAKIANHC